MYLQVDSFLLSVVLCDVLWHLSLWSYGIYLKLQHLDNHELRMCEHVSSVDVMDKIYESSVLCCWQIRSLSLLEMGGSDLVLVSYL